MAMTEQSAGAGGKFRKKPWRRPQSTPYDRPASAFRPTQQQQEPVVGGGVGGASNGWVSKLVDPASRLITAGAHKLLSSVFRKRLLPPPQPQHPSPDEAMEIGDVQPEITNMVAPSETKELVVCRGDDSRISENGGVAELEGILKQKTFTRSEIDHLTELLLSRTAENSVGAQMDILELKSLDEKAVCSRHEGISSLPALVNEAGRELSAAMSTPDLRSKALEDAVASPAELAKAYMGSRPMKASPSAVGMQYEMPREDLSAQYHPFLKAKTPVTSVIRKPANDVGAPANGFMTPRFRGRSAIYSMARTPYSRPQPTEVFKLQAAETDSDVRGASSSAHNTIETQQFCGPKKQVRKRRSSVLESEIWFVGPIRRIRQKPTLLHQKTLSLPASGGSVKHGHGALTNVTEAPSSSIDWSSSHRSTYKAVADSGIPSTSSGYVPSQSIEMAQKIFQQLEKFTPKRKSAEKKADIAGETSSGKMMFDMKDGLANKRISAVESLKVLKTDSRKENGFFDSASVHDHTSIISPEGEEGCSKKSVKPSIDDGAKDLSPNNARDHLDQHPNFDHRQKKRAFQMSAHEDYLELDDDVQTNGVASSPMIKVGESNELAESSAAVSDNPTENAANSAGLSTKKEPSTFLFGANREESPDGFSAAKISGFGLPIVSSSSSGTTIPVEVSTPQSTAEVKKVVEQSEAANVTTAFGSNSAKMAPISFPPPSIVESAPPNNSEPELPNSLTDAAAKADGPDKIDKKSTLLFGDVSKNIGDASNEGSSAKGVFSFVPSNGTTVSNGFPSTASVTTVVTSPIQVSSRLNNLSLVPVSVSSPSVFTFSNGNAIAASTFTSTSAASALITTATTGSSTTQLSTSMTTPGSFNTTFQFGSPAVPSISSTVVTSALQSPAISGAKSNQCTFGKATSSLFDGKPSETASVGKDISSFNASTLKTTSSETQTAAPSVNGSIFNFQASSSAVPVSSSIPSFSSQSTSSALSPAVGFNTPANFNVSSSIFGSSTTVANPSTSGSISASSALGSSSVTLPVSSSINATSSIYVLQSSKPTVFGNIFGTFQSSGFSIGSTASGTSVAGNSTLNVFGAASSSSAASNSAPLVFGSSSLAASVFPASSSALPSTPFPSQSTFGISTPQAFSFGSTSPVGNNDRMSMEDSMAEDSVQVSTPATPVFSVPNSAPSSSFAFGAGAPSAGSPFGPPNQIASQNSPFQPSGSVEFNAGGGAGSFSLGSIGGDKSNRRFVKVKKGIRRK